MCEETALDLSCLGDTVLEPVLEKGGWLKWRLTFAYFKTAQILLFRTSTTSAPCQRCTNRNYLPHKSLRPT